MVNSAGACEACVTELRQIRSDPVAREKRLKSIRRSENGILTSARLRMRRETSQPDMPIRSKLERTAHYEQIGDINKLRAVLNAKPEELTARRTKDAALPQIASIFSNLLSTIHKRPEAINEMPPRAFEELVAELLQKMGHEVTITPATRDGGRDILASFKTPIGPRLTVVECKRHAMKNPVGLSIVERFLYTIREKDKASHGLIATTSRFSGDAVKEAAKYEYLLSLADRDQIIQWLKQFGSWNRHNKSNIWVPE